MSEMSEVPYKVFLLLGDIYSNNGSRLVSGSHEIIRWYVGWSRQTLCLPHKEFKKMATCGAVFGAFKRPCIRPQPRRDATRDALRKFCA